MSYDEWKTTDKEFEANCEWWEYVISLLKCDRCGNDDSDYFKEINSHVAPESGCDVELTIAICTVCGSDFHHSKQIDPRNLH